MQMQKHAGAIASSIGLAWVINVRKYIEELIEFLLPLSLPISWNISHRMDGSMHPIPSFTEEQHSPVPPRALDRWQRTAMQNLT